MDESEESAGLCRDMYRSKCVIDEGTQGSEASEGLEGIGIPSSSSVASKPKGLPEFTVVNATLFLRSFYSFQYFKGKVFP